MDERTWDVMSSFQRFMDEALEVVRAGAQSSGPLLGEVVERHSAAYGGQARHAS